jgi:hypothetical protein
VVPRGRAITGSSFDARQKLCHRSRNAWRESGQPEHPGYHSHVHDVEQVARKRSGANDVDGVSPLVESNAARWMVSLQFAS